MTVSIVNPFIYEGKYYGSSKKAKFISDDYSPPKEYWDRLIYTAEKNNFTCLTPMMCGDNAMYENEFPQAIVFCGKLYKNPIIVTESNELVYLKEASLVDVGFEISVYRPKYIIVEYIDIDDNNKTVRFDGLSARYFFQACQLMLGIHVIECAKPIAQKYALKRYYKKYGKKIIN